MSKRTLWTLGLSMASVFALVGGAAANPEDNWPTWRGPHAGGIAIKGSPPVTWSETPNIKWTVALRGESSSTPVVWENKLFIQSAVPTGAEAAAPAAAAPAEGGRRHPQVGGKPTVPFAFNVVCYDRMTGALIWEKTAREAVPHESRHSTNTHASYSPVTDGKLVWASFGSRGLYCYDLDGNLKWNRDLIEMKTRNSFGEGSSPAIAGDAIIVQMDHEAGSKIFAFNKVTGEPIWEKDRQEITSWSTPLAVEVNGKIQVVTTATDRIRSYDAQTGDIVWECDGLTPNAIPSPVAGFGMVYCTSGFRGYALKAIELGHTGDLTGTAAIKWTVDKGTPYVPSPLLYEDRIYLTSNNRPILSCYDAKTGTPMFVEQRLEGLGELYASPVGVDGRIYIADRDGNVMVIKKSDTLEVLGVNTLDDGFDASPVVIGDLMYLKGDKSLYCIAAQ